MLSITVSGTRGDRPPLIVAHGLYGSARNWGLVSRRLSEHREVVGVDMRNHGDSPHDDDHSYAALAADLGEIIEDRGGPADVLGHSMGGKAAMVLALTAPEHVGRLIVVDIAPVAYVERQQVYLDAMRATDLSGITRRGEADGRLAEHVDDKALRGFLLQNLEIGSDGATWRLNLAALDAYMDEISGFPDLSQTYEGPALFLEGGESDYLDDAHWPATVARFPNAERRTIAGAGHWPHAEKPDAVVAAIEDFLA